MPSGLWEVRGTVDFPTGTIYNRVDIERIFVTTAAPMTTGMLRRVPRMTASSVVERSHGERTSASASTSRFSTVRYAHAHVCFLAQEIICSREVAAVPCEHGAPRARVGPSTLTLAAIACL